MKTDDLWKEMIGLGAGTPANRLRRQATYSNSYDKGKASDNDGGGNGYENTSGTSSSYNSHQSSDNSGNNYGSSISDSSYTGSSGSSSDSGNGYNSNSYTVNSQGGNFFLLYVISNKDKMSGNIW